MIVRFLHPWGVYRAGRVVELPAHIARKLVLSSGPNGEPYAQDVTPWAERSVLDLRVELKARGLKVSGRKDELLERLGVEQ